MALLSHTKISYIQTKFSNFSTTLKTKNSMAQHNVQVHQPFSPEKFYTNGKNSFEYYSTDPSGISTNEFVAEYNTELGKYNLIDSYYTEDDEFIASLIKEEKKILVKNYFVNSTSFSENPILNADLEIEKSEEFRVFCYFYA